MALDIQCLPESYYQTARVKYRTRDIKIYRLRILHGGAKIRIYFRVARGVTALIRAVSGEKQIYSGNLEILPGIGKPGKIFGKYEIFSGH